jgi:ribosome maturation factor RimP
MQLSVVQRAWQVAEPLVVHENMEIVDIEYRRERQGNVLRFYLDREGGVTIDDLAPMSRRLGDVLEVHGVVPGPYTLEVSSPGVNRRLRRPDHFRSYVGKKVRVRTVEHHRGRRSFVGPLRSVGDEGVVVEIAEGEQFIRFDDIAQANYEHEFAGSGIGRK